MGNRARALALVIATFGLLGVLSLSAVVSPATFPGKPGKIVFDGLRGSHGFHLWSVSADGGPAKKLPGSAGCEQPALAPDGRTVVFLKGGTDKVFTQRLDGTHRKRLKAATGGFDPSFSGPAGKRITFERDRNILVVGANGKHLHRLTGDRRGSAPQFSPNGKLIAFADRGAITLMHSDGTHVQTLTPGHGDSYPSFSPNGKRIVFSRDSFIAVMKLDGSHVHVFHHTFGVRPAYSPDGEQITYDTGMRIYVIDTDGTHKRRLTRKHFFSQNPDWIAR